MSTSAEPVFSAERRICCFVAVLVVLVVMLNSGAFSISSSSSGMTPSASPEITPQQQQVTAFTPSTPSAGDASGAASDSSQLSLNQQFPAVAAAVVTLEPSARAPVGVFDGVAYMTPLPVEARGRSLASLFGSDFRATLDIDPGVAASNGTSSSEKLAALTPAELRPLRFALMAKPIPPGLGLTTQLLTYCHLIAAAQLLNRTLIFPIASRTTWFKLINMSATTMPAFDSATPFSYVSNRETASRAMRTRSVSKTGFKWTRELTYGAPQYVKQQLLHFGRRAAGVSVVKFPSMFKMYPFGVEERLNFGRYLCGLVFRSQIEDAASRILGEMATQAQRADPGSSDAARFVSVHLRIEPQDSVAFRRGAPSAQQLREWFRTEVAKLCARYRTRNVFVASGPLGKEYEDAIASTDSNPIVVEGGKRMRVFTKQSLLVGDAASLLQSDFFRESSTKVIWAGKHNIYPTNTRTAAVDLLVLTHGVASAMTSFSSLTPFVYSRQCFAGPQCFGRQAAPTTEGKEELVARGVYLYELGDRGEMSPLRLFRCGYRMQELLRGGGVRDPPPQDDLFAENVRSDRMQRFA